jgi:hypothetical protein
VTGVARDFTVVDHPRREHEVLVLPVAGGDLLVEAGDWRPELLDLAPGSRVTARVVDSGPGWWLAAAIRVDRADC